MRIPRSINSHNCIEIYEGRRRYLNTVSQDIYFSYCGEEADIALRYEVTMEKSSNNGRRKADPAGSGKDTASPARSLFHGNILEEHLFPYPNVKAEEVETLQMVLSSIDKFMARKEKEFRSFDVEGEQSAEYLDGLRELGLFGLIIPEEYGGVGLSTTGYSRVIQQTSRYDRSTSLTIGAHSSIGMRGLLLFGSAEQKKRYLAKLASGENIAAFCLTESGSGSDAASIKTSAAKNSDGSWTLSGEKIWITNGGIADFFTVFARTGSEAGKLSAFIVERSWKGVSTGPKEDKMGIRASCTTTVTFDNVRVPAENLLGEEGRGFMVAMSILNNGRTGLGGGCVGAMKECIRLASKQAKERKQFGRPIADFTLIKEKIAKMTVNCFAAESVVYMVSHYIDSKMTDFSVEAAISKVFATEALWETAYEALQVAGGNGFMREFPYEMIVRDARINMIFEGTNEILRLYIALSGMKDAGASLKELQKSVNNIFNDPIKGFGVLSAYASKKLSELTPLGRDTLSVNSALLEDAAIYEQGTKDFARAVESVLRRYGSDIIGTQLITKRVADSATALFVGLCVLSRVNSMLNARDPESCTRERAISKIFARQCRRRVSRCLQGINENEDDTLKALSDAIVQEEKFPWDIFS